MHNKIKSVVVALLVTIVGILSPVSAMASDFKANLNTSVVINSFVKPATILTTLDVHNLQSTATPTEVTIPVYGANIKSLKASYANGEKIIVTLDAITNSAKLQTTKSLKGKGKSWKLRLSYTADLVEKFGDAKLTLFQATPTTLGSIAIGSEKRTINLDLSLGVPTRLGGVQNTSLDFGRQVISWKEKTGAINYPTGLFFGESALVDINITTKLSNHWPWWRKVKLVLPPDTNQQKVVLKSITPAPTKIRIDKDSNIIAEYRLRPFGSVNVTAESEALIGNYTYDLQKAVDKLSDEEKATFADYLLPVDGWNGEAITLTEKSSIDKKINTILADVKNKTTENVSTEETVNSLVGALRINGIPSRVVVGLLTERGKTGVYYWAEAYISGVGWTTVDVNTKNIKTADARFVALAVRSESSSSPTPYFEKTTLVYKKGASLPVNDFKPTVSSKTYILFPGVGLRTSTVRLPVGVATDNAALLVYGDRITPLGSLAPAQKVTSRDPLIGGKAHKKYVVQYGILDNKGQVSSLATTTSSISWLPFITLSGLLILTIPAVFMWRRKETFPKVTMPKMFKRDKGEDVLVEEKTQSLSLESTTQEIVAFEPPKPPTKKPRTLIQ